MSTTFLITLVVALLAIVYWRVVLIVVGAFLLAMVLTGLNSVSDVMAGQRTPPADSAPERPGVQPDGGGVDVEEGAEDGAPGPTAPGRLPR